MVKHFQDDPNPPTFIKALAEVRHLATRDDQYAAKVRQPRIHLHGSVRLFHAQLLAKPASTFRVTDETNEFCTTPLFKGNGKVLKRDWSIITAFNEHEGCSHAQTIVLNGHNRNWDCCCSVSCLVACRYATSSDHCIIVDQSHRDDGNLQGSSTS